jgi:hypothetical protein
MLERAIMELEEPLLKQLKAIDRLVSQADWKGALKTLGLRKQAKRGQSLLMRDWWIF